MDLKRSKFFRAACLIGGWALVTSSTSYADNFGPAACAPECAAPAACAPACEAPCAPECATPCAPECATPEECAPVCGDEVVCGEEDDGCCTLMDMLNSNEDGGFLDGLNFGGWTQVGYHSHRNGLFNNHPHRVNLHQQYFYVEKVADGSEGVDFGFRADVVYGVDGPDTQAFGNPSTSFDEGWDHGSYGWAIPQLYAEIASGDLSVKVGHFYTLVGYEVVPAIGNFFYSHAYTMYNSEPFTHSGAIATYSASDDLTLYGGWTAGWDTGFSQADDGSNFLGGFAYALNEDTTLTYITTIGDFGNRGGANPEGYSHSIVMTTTLSEKLEYVFQSDLVETNVTGDHQFGVNQYMFYTINEKLKAGVRAEWWKNSDNSQYEVTAGVNILATKNLIFRPEIRHDWNPAGQNIIGDNNFFTFGMDAILTY